MGSAAPRRASGAFATERVATVGALESLSEDRGKERRAELGFGSPKRGQVLGLDFFFVRSLETMNWHLE